MADTQVSDTWIKFWDEMCVYLYGKAPCIYEPVEGIKRIMVKYKISTINEKPRTAKIHHPGKNK